MAGGVLGGIVGAALGTSIGYGVGLLWGTAPVAGSNGAIALWSGGKEIVGKAAAEFAAKTGAKLVTDTFAGQTLSLVEHVLPKAVSKFLWEKLSAEFVSGAASATIFLLESGIKIDSVFFTHEIWVLLAMEIERVINFVG